jgi:hypothetical protein
VFQVVECKKTRYRVEVVASKKAFDATNPIVEPDPLQIAIELEFVGTFHEKGGVDRHIQVGSRQIPAARTASLNQRSSLKHPIRLRSRAFPGRLRVAFEPGRGELLDFVSDGRLRLSDRGDLDFGASSDAWRSRR